MWWTFLYFKEFSETRHTLTPSTTPCSPAPGRCLLIVRDDLQATTSGMFLSFDSILSEPSRTQATAYERYGSLSPIAHIGPLVHLNRVNGGEKRRWSTLRNILPFVGPSGDRPQVPSTCLNSSDGRESQRSSIGRQLEQGNYDRTDCSNEYAFTTDSDLIDTMQDMSGKPYNNHSFKFSLEWVDKGSNPAESDRSLSPPKLPVTAHVLLQPTERARSEYSPCMPTDRATNLCKYTGRALSEWDLIIKECQNFFERRRNEGVPNNHKVETPTLGVELFKKLA